MHTVQRAVKRARNLLATAKVTKAPIKVYELAKKHAQLIEVEMDDEISGMLVPVPSSVGEKKNWVIVVNKRHAKVRKRFTVAHELAHLLLHDFNEPHADRGFKVRFRNPQSSEGAVLEEIEANQFAAELLMPAHLIIDRLIAKKIEYVPSDPDDDKLAEIAEEFGVSRQALGIRLANLLT